MEMNACLYLQQTGVRELDRVQRCYQTTHLVREALADPILREYCSRFIFGKNINIPGIGNRLTPDEILAMKTILTPRYLKKTHGLLRQTVGVEITPYSLEVLDEELRRAVPEVAARPVPPPVGAVPIPSTRPGPTEAELRESPWAALTANDDVDDSPPAVIGLTPSVTAEIEAFRQRIRTIDLHDSGSIGPPRKGEGLSGKGRRADAPVQGKGYCSSSSRAPYEPMSWSPSTVTWTEEEWRDWYDEYRQRWSRTEGRWVVDNWGWYWDGDNRDGQWRFIPNPRTGNERSDSP